MSGGRPRGRPPVQSTPRRDGLLRAGCARYGLLRLLRKFPLSVTACYPFRHLAKVDVSLLDIRRRVIFAIVISFLSAVGVVPDGFSLLVVTVFGTRRFHRVRDVVAGLRPGGPAIRARPVAG